MVKGKVPGIYFMKTTEWSGLSVACKTVSEVLLRSFLFYNGDRTSRTLQNASDDNE